MSNNEDNTKRKGCPCCAFDLFLPPSLRESNPGEAAPSETTENLELPLEPQEAASLIASSNNSSLIIVDTHGHAQLERDRDEAYVLFKNEESKIQLKSITCAVEPSDWRATLDFASKSDSTLPALGVHPWYLEGLPDNWLEELELLLEQHPSAIVGEIGLCKMARFVRQHPEGKAVALAIQRAVFKQQMILAAKLRRPVSVHCVNQHGAFVSLIKELLEETKDAKDPWNFLPPAIGMHSFTGAAHHAKELLKLETQVAPNQALFYFGFSHTVNYAMCTSDKARRKGREAVRAVPEDRLLVESDVHASQDLLGGTAGAIAYVAWARDVSVLEVAEVTSRNGMAFIACGVQQR
jgi:Tat protein secretion system quality control protein TatD with DNase activity